MRTLTSTLTAAQQAANRTPYVKLEAKNRLYGAVNLLWERLYTGSEADGISAITLPSDGSLVRVRVTPATDSRKLYRQRITSPGTGSDFSAWTYLSQYGVTAAALCSLGAEVSLFYLQSTCTITRKKSTDSGATWSSTDYPGYSPSGTGVTGAAAAYKSANNLALFFIDTYTVYVIELVAGVWQSRTAWTLSTGSLSGIACCYDDDWKLVLSGQDTDGNYKVWSLIYGDGDEAADGAWSALKTIATAPSGGDYQYSGVSLDQPDQYRLFYTEIFSGTTAYNRPFSSHTLPGTAYPDSRWREPVPFETESASGLALAHSATYAWAATPSGVWRASLPELSLDLSADIRQLKHTGLPEDGQLEVELDNSGGDYAALPAPLGHGCQIDFSPGYQTPSGNEYSAGLSFKLEGYEYTRLNGQAGLVLYAADGWQDLADWQARYQLRWNASADEASVKEILTQILARCGLVLSVVSESAEIDAYYPDFTLHAGDNGQTAVKKLLGYVSDVIFIEGNSAYLVNPLAADSAVYSYGTAHVIREGRYRSDAWRVNRVKAEGDGITAESFDWEEIEKQGDRMELIEDLNLGTEAEAASRGEALLRKAEIEAGAGYLKVPVNCGQQLYDGIDLTDAKAGLAAATRRIRGLYLAYQPEKGLYEHKLLLGGV